MKILKKFWLIIVLVLALIVFAVLKLLKKKPKDMTQAAQDVLDDMGVEAGQVDYNDKALNIAHNLGTAYPWYDPRHWTENDNVVFDCVKDLTQSQFDVIARLYNEVYAKGNNLSADLARLLDAEYYEQLKVR